MNECTPREMAHIRRVLDALDDDRLFLQNGHRRGRVATVEPLPYTSVIHELRTYPEPREGDE